MASPKPIDFPHADWQSKRNDNAVGIEVRLMMQNAHLLIAELRFQPQASFDAHSAPWDCHVLCLAGSGFVLVGEETFPIAQGQSVFWPQKVLHQMWTTDNAMHTQMIEHVHQVADPRAAWQQHVAEQGASA